MTQPLPGWSFDSFNDPRPHPFGPLSKQTGHYKGLFRNGRRVIFHYTVGSLDVLDMPGTVTVEEAFGFTRTVRVRGADRSAFMLVDDIMSRPSQVQGGVARFSPSKDEPAISVAATSPRLILKRRALALYFPHEANPTTVQLVFSPGKDDVDTLLKAANPPEDLDALTKGGPALWPETITTAGQRAADDKPYVVDTLTLPADNPWKSWIRPTGFDFFSDGRIALCTLSGDVWVVSGAAASARRTASYTSAACAAGKPPARRTARSAACATPASHSICRLISES